MTLRVHYHRSLLARAQSGNHSFTEKLRAAVASRGVTLELCEDDEATRRASARADGHSLVLMHKPFSPRQMVLRLAYLYPFWRIEQTPKRWEFKVAQVPFDPAQVNASDAAGFCKRRRGQHLDGAAPGLGDGSIYVALQGVIRKTRSFQSMSPVSMLAQTLHHAEGRPVIAGLHPNEDYTKADLAALEKLRAKASNLNVVTGGMDRLLPAASLVVTQNSSVALMGYFLHKPAVLFGRIDFHHVAANVLDLGVEQAFAVAQTMTPDYERYLFWFFRQMSINAAAPDVEKQILAALRDCGWRP